MNLTSFSLEDSDGLSQELTNGNEYNNQNIDNNFELIEPLLSSFDFDQDNEKSDRSNSSEQHSKVECGSTLGQMIRRRYLLSRKSARLSSNTIFVNDQLNDSFSFEHNKVTADLDTTALKISYAF